MASSMSSVMQAPKVVEKYCVCHLSTGVGVCIPCVLQCYMDLHICISTPTVLLNCVLNTFVVLLNPIIRV